MIELSSLSFAFNPERPIIQDLSLTVEKGEWVSLVGPNGCGKSTLLSLIAGVRRLQAGSIKVAGLSLDSALGRSKRKQWAKNVALMPQKPTLPEGMLVHEYVSLGRYPHGDHKPSLVEQTLSELNLEQFADRSMSELSGGETQRVSLARSLVQEPKVLLLDEPTSALDIGHAQEVLELVDDLRAKRQLTVIAAMHDLTLAAAFGEKIATLNGGRIHRCGPARQVLTKTEIESLYAANVQVIVHEGQPVIIPVRTVATPDSNPR